MRQVALMTVMAGVITSAITTVLLSGLFFGASTARSADEAARNEAAPFGLGVGGLAQGDVDCSLAIGAVDALKVLRYNAGLTYTQTEPCTDIGALLEVSGYERVLATDQQTGVGPLSMSVTCPAGKSVFGGGVRRTSGTLSGLSWAVLESYPQANGTTWGVLIHQTDAGTRNYEVSAICAPASP